MTDAPTPKPENQPDSPPPPLAPEHGPEQGAGHRWIRRLALYIFPAILLGLMVTVVVSAVRLAPRTSPETQTAQATADTAGGLALPEQPAPLAADQTPSVTASATDTPSLDALTALSQRLDRIEAEQARRAEAGHSVQAALMLERAAQGDAPFRAELDAAGAALDAPALLMPLRPLADRGVPSVLTLSREFAPLAARAHSASQRPSRADDPLGWLGQWLTSVVSIRRTDTIVGDSPDARLNRAEARLMAGDLRGAVRELEALPPAARTILQPWLEHARQRLLVDDTTRSATELSLSRLSGLTSQGDAL